MLEQKRQELLIQASIATADWRAELALGIISDDEKASLTEWMQYIKAVKLIDVNKPQVISPDRQK